MIANVEKDLRTLIAFQSPAVLARFWSKINVPNPDGCMTWQGKIQRNGYGQFCLPRNRAPQLWVSAHRAALLLAVGLPPGVDMESAHSCRNRGCVAPAHLRWATTASNAADRIADGTQTRFPGETHPRARLTESQVNQIRLEYGSGRSQRDLSHRYGVSQTAISNIITGKRWVA